MISVNNLTEQTLKKFKRKNTNDGENTKEVFFLQKMGWTAKQSFFFFFLEKGGGEKWRGDCVLFYAKGKFGSLC